MNLVFSKPYEHKRHILYDRSSLSSLRIFFKPRKTIAHGFKIVTILDIHTFKGVNKG